MSERSHDWGCSERVRYLINRTVPASNVSQAFWAWERHDGFDEIFSGFDTSVSD